MTNTVAASDADLVSWARDGEDSAFEELFRRHRPAVAALVARIVRDEARAEDVTQEAFLSALRRLRETDCEIVFKPWILQIARNASIDVYRRRARTEEVSIDRDGELPAADVAQLPRLPAPDRSVIDKERLDHLRGALAELSESHHRIIVLRELEGLSYREIAERMQLTPAAVESTLFRARRRLEHEYVQIDTGRRCQSMAALIARISEGLESGRDRRRLDRHARRCPSCRRRARELGVEPMLPRRGPVRRVAALFPVPALLRRREIEAQLPGVGAQGAAPLQGLAASALEPGVTIAKAVAAVVAAALVGGGATLGGFGPIADGRGGTPEGDPTRAQSAGHERPRTLLLDDRLGPPLPARPRPEAGSAARPSRRASPEGRRSRSGPSGYRRSGSKSGSGAGASPTRDGRRTAPSLPLPTVRPPAVRLPAPPAPPEVRLPAPSEGTGTGGIPRLEPPSLPPVGVNGILDNTVPTVPELPAPDV